jgi:hypothetical protein
MQVQRQNLSSSSTAMHNTYHLITVILDDENAVHKFILNGIKNKNTPISVHHI